MSFSFMAFALAMLAQESVVVATANTTAAPVTAAPEVAAEPRILCKNIEVTGSRLAKKKKVCLPEGEWSESARRNMRSGSKPAAN
jgi:hypothetical protein